MPRSRAERQSGRRWIGKDMSHQGAFGSSRRLVPALVAGCLIAGLGIAWLRVDLIRVRYGLAEALREEKVLLEQQREARARVRALRDPARLAEAAERYGLTRPERIIDLPSTVLAEAPEPDGGRP
jgi:hypothetical protein